VVPGEGIGMLEMVGDRVVGTSSSQMLRLATPDVWKVIPWIGGSVQGSVFKAIAFRSTTRKASVTRQRSRPGSCTPLTCSRGRTNFAPPAHR
jgi:hypothetical protein